MLVAFLEATVRRLELRQRTFERVHSGDGSRAARARRLGERRPVRFERRTRAKAPVTRRRHERLSRAEPPAVGPYGRAGLEEEVFAGPFTP
jgi:hypothetical protein